MKGAALAMALALLGCDAPAAIEDPSVAITPLRLPAVELPGASLHATDRPTLLHFWATWCAPCRRELPSLFRMAEEVEGVRVVAVTDEPWSAVERHFAPDPVPRWVARDPDGTLARTLGVASLPDTYVVDVEGVARRRVAGSRDWSRPALRNWVASLSPRVASRLDPPLGARRSAARIDLARAHLSQPTRPAPGGPEARRPTLISARALVASSPRPHRPAAPSLARRGAHVSL